MFGAFRVSQACLGGRLLRMKNYLSKPQRYRLRERLRDQDNVVDTLVKSGLRFNSLDRALLLPRENEMPEQQKYFIFSKRAPNQTKPWHTVRHWTKSVHPRIWPIGYKPIKPKGMWWKV